tara:strand:+ start:1357 stop:1584 length:228 start_codon:yes stop_codon:yes gene_type:complete
MDETNIFIFYEGEKVHLTPSDLRNQSLFKQAVMNQTNKVPPILTAQEFKDMSTDLFDVLKKRKELKKERSPNGHN